MAFLPIARLIRVTDPPSWAWPCIVGLGLASAVFEGASLYLFIPLIQSLGAAGGAGNPIGGLFDRVIAPVPAAWRVPALVAAVVGTIVLKNLVGFLNHFVTRLAEGQVAHRLRLRVFAQTVASCIDYRVQSKRTDIVNILATETWKVSGGLTLLYRLVICACAFAVFLVLLVLISARLTVLAMLFLAAGALVVHLATRRADALGGAVVAENKRFGLRMWESVDALQLIRSFGREDYEQARFADRSETVRRRLLRLDLLWAVPGPLSEVFTALLVGLLILGSGLFGIGFAALATFLAVLYRMQGPVREILMAKVTLASLSGPVAEIADYLAATAAPYIRGGTRRLDGFERAIALDGVSFRYAPGEKPALDRVSFTIPKGRTTAIVGRSGAGKSTLMTLLFRFEDPTAGEILVDGVPLTALDLADWRGRLALMSQDVRLFNGTVAENIAYGDLAAPPEAIRRAAEVAGADDFIRDLPGGYDAALGDRGMRLSGGQRQRIALARTILRDPDILLLDEATNALDSESEHAFQDALARYAEGRTVVVIAHRLSTVENADQVVVLDEGRVVECGPPAALLANQGRFARLHGLQAGRLARRG